jgi:asparaginyl-tRNA synthetase
LISKAPGGEEAIGNKIHQDASPDLLFQQRHLVLRGDIASSCLRFRAIATKAFRDFFDSKHVSEVSPPLMVQTQAEGGSTVFDFQYYGETAYLTQSSQLYLETVLPSIGDAYCITESFRAEKSHTRRHLSEFTHIEGELGFITFDDLLCFLEDMVPFDLFRLLLL